MGKNAGNMLNGTNWRDPILINTIGHTAGILLFGFIIVLLIRDRRAHGIRQTKLSISAAGLALAWNVGSITVFRIDHDQAFQSTVVTRYQINKNAEYVDFSWRYDSGLVVSGIPDAGAALGLTPNQQVSIGLACNGTFASVANPLSDCTNPDGTAGKVTSRLLTLPQGGYGSFASQENDDHNPDRVKPRSTFNLSIGTDNLLHAEGRQRFTAAIQVENLTNNIAVYNFLSTFSGTHFLQPRTVIARIGFVF